MGQKRHSSSCQLRMNALFAIVISSTSAQNGTICKKGPIQRQQRHAALGDNFHGEGRQRSFPLEDQYVFEHFFSANGNPPYRLNGTFVELGAHDGFAVSNTLWLEQALGWSGVLIEASRGSFKSLQHNRGLARNTLRNAVVCPLGQTVQYVEPKVVKDAVMAGITSWMPEGNKNYAANRKGTRRELQCTPLSAILREAGVAHVDYFSLDVEGAELIVLQTIDWSAVTFGVLMVELDGKAPTKDADVRRLLRKRGFRYSGVTGSHCRAELWLGPSHSQPIR